MSVERWDRDSMGPLSESALRRVMERRGCDVTRHVYPPGTVFPEHTHGVDKIDAVLSGQFLMVIEGEVCLLEAGDQLAVPRGAVHSARVVGEEPVISLDGVIR